MNETAVAPYNPTSDQRIETLRQGDFLKLSGDGTFATLQGEGMTAGMPVVFVRLHGCNLKCGFQGEGWRCDTWYTWDRTTEEFWTESSNVPVAEVAERVRNDWDAAHSDKENTSRMVISGGEPLIQQRKIVDLLDALPDWDVEIETNGTITPCNELARCQINCSPKLASSGNHKGVRYRPEAIRKISTFPNHWFKFVITDHEEQDIAEVREIVAANGLDYRRVLLMGEGSNPDVLRNRFSRLKEIAAGLGCLTTQRNHIFWFGDKRRT